MFGALFVGNAAGCFPSALDVTQDNVTSRDDFGCGTEPSNRTDFDAGNLAALADNGGPTPTMELAPDQIATTAVRAASCVALVPFPTLPPAFGQALVDLGTDQRGDGFFRPAQACTAGAFQPDALGQRPLPTPPSPDGGPGGVQPSPRDSGPCGALTARPKC